MGFSRTVAAIAPRRPRGGRLRAAGGSAIVRNVPLEYFQGSRTTRRRPLLLAGLRGALCDRRDLVERARLPVALPDEVRAQGFNHIGDFTWDRAEGGG
jgi:hypothetical protein